MLNVDSFLCVDLETGGLIIGWIYLILYILGAITFLILLILTCVLSCNDYRDYLGKDGVDLCNGFHGILIGFLVVFILLCIGFGFISWRCIQGAKARNHAHVRPMMILLAILTICSLLQIFNFSVSGVLQGLIEALINGYCFVVIYSLYERYRQEATSGVRQNVQYKVGGYPDGGCPVGGYPVLEKV